MEVRKKKILRIVTRLNIGGVSLNVSNLAKHLPENMYETKVVHGLLGSDEGDMSYVFDGIDKIFIPTLQRELNIVNDIKTFIEIVKIIKRYKPDIVHTHTAKAGLLGRIAAKICGVKIIIHTFHGNVFSGYFNKKKTEFFKLLERICALCSTKIIAISKTQKEDLINYGIAKTSKIEVIPLGFDFSKVIPENDYKTDFRDRFDLSKDDILIGIIGRVVPIKNHIMFINIAEKVLYAFDKKVKFIVVGDGELKRTLEDEVLKRDLSSKIIFTGYTNNLKEIYNELSYVMLTSKNEGTPVAIIEALANKKITFATNVGGIADFIENGISGFYFDLADENRFAEKMIEVLKKHGSIELNKIKENGYSVAMEKFSYKRLINDIDKLYTNL